jgi:lysozyme
MKASLLLTIAFGLLATLSAQKIESKEWTKPFAPELIKPKTKLVCWQTELVNGVKRFESFVSSPYKCPAGVVTVGYGHTGPRAKTSISPVEAENLLIKELEECKEIVLRNVNVPLTEWQLCALVSFTFNAGEGNLRKLVNGKNRLNDGNYKSVKEILPLYRKGGGNVLRGLEIRRAWEVSMWEGEFKLDKPHHTASL